MVLQVYSDAMDQFFDETLTPLTDSISGGLAGRYFAGYGYSKPEFTFGLWSNINSWRFVDRGDLGLVLYRLLRSTEYLPLWLSFPFSDVDVSRPEGPYPFSGERTFEALFANQLLAGALRQDKRRVRGRFININKDINEKEYRRTPRTKPIYLGINNQPSSEGDGRI